MKLEGVSTAGSKAAFIAGWIISAIPILMMGVGGLVVAVGSRGTMEQNLVQHGYATHHVPIILALEIGCVVIYAIPQTAILGAILLTGYLGGAVATHVRIDESQWSMPVIVGVLVWLGVFLRDQRLRALLPIRKQP